MSKIAARTTSLSQKIGLVLAGIGLSLILLEGFLRLGGWWWTVRQERANQVTLAADEFRILCLGESTTALGGENSYPAQLAEILRQARPGVPFRIINKGRVSKTSSDILAGLKRDLDRYRPQLVVGMIGVNDRPAGFWDRSPLARALSGLRVVGFFQLLGEHLRARFGAGPAADPGRPAGPSGPDTLVDNEEIKGRDTSRQVAQEVAGLDAALQELATQLAQTPPADQPMIRARMERLKTMQSWLLVHLAWHYRMRQQYAQAEAYGRQAVGVDAQNYGAYVELGRALSEQERYEEALPLLLRARAMGGGDSVLASMEAAHCYDRLGQPEQALTIYQQVLSTQPTDFRLHRDIGTWLNKNGYLAEAGQVLREAIRQHPQDYYLYEQMAEVYAKSGSAEQSAFYAQEAEDLRGRAEHYLPGTVRNYQQIAREIRARGIPLICMQYPLRSIEPLRAIFPNQEDLFFLENRAAFRAALLKEKYSEYFTDSFAGDFGHCTSRGNRLIAENLAALILREFFPQP